MTLSVILSSLILLLLFVSDSFECGCENVAKVDDWWGPADLKGFNDTSIRPFKVVFSEEELGIMTLPGILIYQVAVYARQNLLVAEYVVRGARHRYPTREGHKLGNVKRTLQKSSKLTHVMGATVYNRLPSNVTAAMIQELRNRLLNYRAPSPTFDNVGFQYGFNSKELPTWTNYWANDYPFQEREDYLNKFPQFKTNVQGLDIHFIRVVPEVPEGTEVIPLLLLHGWPGSVREFYETIPHLTAVSGERDFAVEVIAPSLPGFGFSDGAARPGLSAEKMATVLRNLMHRVGHERFYVQGGDWGAIVGSNIATMYQEEVLGYHTNLGLTITSNGLLMQLLGSIFPPMFVHSELAVRMYPLMERLLALLKESGYLHLQATKPDTLGIGLSDSPAGLLAYILQIFSVGTRPCYNNKEDGGLTHYPRSTLIDNLMMYWASNSVTTSFRIYAESLNKQFSYSGLASKVTKVPTWIMQARYEIVYQPPIILRTKYPNLLNTTVREDGGHFLALEMPKVFADDVLDSLKAFRDWWSEAESESSGYVKGNSDL